MFYILTRDDCPWCDRAMEALNNRGEAITAFLYLEHPMIVKLMGKADLKTVPQIWHEGQYVGGYTELLEYLEELDK